MIFETLNARGEPLLPADLLRNYIFLRAARHGEPQESLYAKFWAKFDDPFWREESRQGRLSRPRSDLFMQHFLASRQMRDVPVRHLFVEHKFWIERKKPFPTVREELKTLARQRDHYRRLIEPQKGDALFALANFLNSFDMSTAYPLLLSLLEAGIDERELSKIAVLLESYIVRRAVCGLTTKNYTRNMLGLIRAFGGASSASEAICKHLLDLKGDSAEWSTDQAFRLAWESSNAFLTLNNPKMVFVMTRLSQSYLQPKSETIVIDSPLTVEHLMPRSWQGSWPLADGSTGLTELQLVNPKPGDPRYDATLQRNRVVQTFGNLTILTQALNSTVSNGPWKDKKPEIMNSSLLPLNLQLAGEDEWNEESIRKRGADLFERALKIWPAGV